MKPTIEKLYGFIARLVSMLEEELDELGANKSKSAITVKRNITDTLNKLVTLIIQLNKLSKDDMTQNNESLPSEDAEIIERFLKKYQ